MRHIVCCGMWVGVLALNLPGASGADFKTDKPAVVCGYLEKVGLKVTGYEKIGKDLYFASAEQSVGEDGSTIEYNVEGTKPGSVSKLYVNMKIKAAADAKLGRATLLAASEVLVQKSTGKPLPAEVRKSIEDGGDGTWKVGDCSVEVSKIGKGDKYTLQIVIR
jgi:hypothetical protein